jgi:hypothetical protein
MNPNIWGPHAWKFLHSITLIYPDNPSEQDKINMKTFFTSVGPILPCHKCRNNFGKHLIIFPLNLTALESREKLVKWLINIHNEVNKMTNQPLLTYEQVILNFIDVKTTGNLNVKTIIISALFLLLIILLLIFYVMLNNININE